MDGSIQLMVMPKVCQKITFFKQSESALDRWALTSLRHRCPYIYYSNDKLYTYCVEKNKRFRGRKAEKNTRIYGFTGMDLKTNVN